MVIRIAVIAILLASTTSAQHHSGVVDPLTAEPIPYTVDPPPAAVPSAAEGYTMWPLHHLPGGTSRAVGHTASGELLYTDGTVIAVATASIERGEAQITELGSAIVDSKPQALFAEGQRVFVATRGEGGLKILHLSLEPFAFHQVSSLTGVDALAVVASGSTAYIGAGMDGVHVVNVVAPGGPAIIATIPTGGSANGLHLEGGLLYLANGSGRSGDGLLIFDVSEPTSAQPLGSFDPGGFATSVAVAGGVALLGGTFGLVTIDVGDPADPSLLDTFDATGGTVFDVSIRGPRAAASGKGGAFYLDISDPGKMELVGYVETDSEALSNAISPNGNNLLVADRFAGTRLINLLPPGELEQLAFVRNGGFSNAVELFAGRLYVADKVGELRIFDILGPQAPILRGRLEIAADPVKLVHRAGKVYVSHGEGSEVSLTVVDASQPSEPGVVSTWKSAFPAYGLRWHDGRLFVALGDGGLLVLDVGDPEEPIELGRLEFGAYAVDVEIDDELAYLTTSDQGLFVVDVADPSVMSVVSSAPQWPALLAIAPEPPVVFAPRDVVYVADADAGLREIDISDPEALESHHTWPVATTARDVASGGAFYSGSETLVSIADDFFGLRAYYFGNDPGYEFFAFRSPDRGLGVAIDQTPTVALATGETGVYLFLAPFDYATEPVAAEAVVRLGAIHPNPASGRAVVPVTLAVPAEVSVQVFDLLGRRVMGLVPGALQAGTHAVELDVASLPSGTYLVHVEAGRRSGSTRFNVVR